MLDTHEIAAKKPSTGTLSDGIVHGKKNLKLIEVNYKRNVSSNFTERMVELQNSFSYADHSDHFWVQPEFSLLYGSPVYTAASEAQKKALNHLYWVCFYNYSIGGEVTTMVYNQLTCGAFYPLGGYETLCRELDVETSQERAHVEAFRTIGQQTEMALLGDLIFDRPMPNYVEAALIHPQKGARSFIRNSPAQFYAVQVGVSPFVASQYYTVRGLRNIQLKVKEYRHSQYCQELEKAGAFVPAPTAVSHFHYLDEAFHTATSQLISHDLYKDFKKPSAMEIFASNVGIFGVQRTMQTLSGAVPGIFTDDSNYIPLVYRMLQTPLFGMDRREALQAVRQCFCAEHEGFHVAARYHEKALSDNRKYMEEVDYLWPINRELRIMAKAHLSTAIKSNIQSFKRFEQTLSV
ncbi:MAG: hypothetical protein H7Y37_10430 [Anaerolineae bacterium]|nr:hypothetical protein [Gloeobacterales cyanobacterium ES-bin-313]